MGTNLTIRDIARLAGVSKSTVSRVLNQSTSVDAATREHVLQVMSAHSFIPSIPATSLRGRSRLIGFLVPALTWELILEIVVGIAQVIEPISYEMILYCCSPDKDYREIVDRILSTQLIGGLLALPHDTQSPEHLVELHQQGLPVVLLNTQGMRIDLPLVVADNYGGAYRAVQHLIQLGHRRIGFFGGPEDIPCFRERYQAYCDALYSAGLSPQPDPYQSGDFGTMERRPAAEKLLARDELPTAFFTCNDLSAYAILDAAQERGIRVPEDLAVVGFDDIPPSAQTRPALTTIHQPFREMGQCATELLLSLMDAQYPLSTRWQGLTASYLPAGMESVAENDHKPLQLQLPTYLVTRESCGSAHLDVVSQKM